MGKTKDKWVILCGTGMVTDYLTNSEIVEATEKEMFELSPNGIEGGLVEDVCGG